MLWTEICQVWKVELRLLKYLISPLHHNFGLLDEVLLQHGALFDGLDRHLVLSPPLAEPHLAKLTTAKLLHEGQLAGVYLPLFCMGGGRYTKGEDRASPLGVH